MTLIAVRKAGSHVAAISDVLITRKANDKRNAKLPFRSIAQETVEFEVTGFTAKSLLISKNILFQWCGIQEIALLIFRRCVDEYHRDTSQFFQNCQNILSDYVGETSVSIQMVFLGIETTYLAVSAAPIGTAQEFLMISGSGAASFYEVSSEVDDSSFDPLINTLRILGKCSSSEFVLSDNTKDRFGGWFDLLVPGQFGWEPVNILYSVILRTGGELQLSGHWALTSRADNQSIFFEGGLFLADGKVFCDITRKVDSKQPDTPKVPNGNFPIHCVIRLVIEDEQERPDQPRTGRIKNHYIVIEPNPSNNLVTLNEGRINFQQGLIDHEMNPNTLEEVWSKIASK